MSSSFDGTNRPRVGIQDLPGEILSHVFEIYISSHLRPSWAGSTEAIHYSVRQLQLRLVCKRWADIIISRYFWFINIRNPERLQVLLENWTTLYADAPVYSERRCPVIKLKIDSVWFHKSDYLQGILLETEQSINAASGSNPTASVPALTLNAAVSPNASGPSLGISQPDSLLDPEDDDSHSIENPENDAGLAVDGDSDSSDPAQVAFIIRTQLCSMDTTIKILDLLGQNLKSLEITLVNSFAFPPSFVAAVTRMRFLQRLDICYRYRLQVPMGRFQKNTLIDLLQSLPQLQYLKFQCRDLLPDFTNSGISLPNLRLLGLVDLIGNSDKGILSLCHLVQHRLRYLELISDHQNTNYIVPMLQLVRKTLQALNVSTEKLALVSNLDFPQLQVFGPTHFDFDSPKVGLEDNCVYFWSMLRNVRTLAIAPKGCWTAMLGYFFDCWNTSKQNDTDPVSIPGDKKSPFHYLPNLRHVIFVPKFPSHIPLVILKDLFGRHHIQIHAGDYHHLKDIERLDQLLHTRTI
ncbi:hypothetical protein CROQUDRAFT_667215 [Cronartium quercuum f. sp. fusiforme G11]|uniref:F-box domain-containing protein n=1 Tax=Cronartium quercuum f. sp. fusiforme G11 TaxID=708437 RepID=A0A9P6NRY9_9BASI|nr:hypothetical protein CROQUDRAFT_667215 [Cronartium quercuum f. sp. fusiforme G11]